MKVGFIGAGRMATTMGRHFLTAGHEIVLSNSKGPESLCVVVAELGPGASAGAKQHVSSGSVHHVDCNPSDVAQSPPGIAGNAAIISM